MPIFHMYMLIDVAQEKIENARDPEKYCRGMFNVSLQDFYDSIADMRAKGIEVISAEKCDNKKPCGRCAGHPSPNDKTND